jgi:hypothetical protein
VCFFTVAASRCFFNPSAPDFWWNLNECDEEMELVRKEMTVRKVHVIPLLIRPSGWQHTFLKELQPLPMNQKTVPQNRSNREQTIYDIAEYIRKAVEKMHRDLLERD